MALVWGARNPVPRVRIAQGFAERLGPEVFDVIEEGTYLVTWEHPERVLATIERIDRLCRPNGEYEAVAPPRRSTEVTGEPRSAVG